MLYDVVAAVVVTGEDIRLYIFGNRWRNLVDAWRFSASSELDSAQMKGSVGLAQDWTTRGAARASAGCGLSSTGRGLVVDAGAASRWPGLALIVMLPVFCAFHKEQADCLPEISFFGPKASQMGNHYCEMPTSRYVQCMGRWCMGIPILLRVFKIDVSCFLPHCVGYSFCSANFL